MWCNKWFQVCLNQNEGSLVFRPIKEKDSSLKEKLIALKQD
jgi:hypothetical protein